MRTVLVLEKEVLCSTEIVSVQIYNRFLSAPGFPLDDYLVPYTSTELLESESTVFLENYYPEALQKICPIDEALLAARMGLAIEYVHLPAGTDVRAQFYFEPQVIQVLGNKGRKIKRKIKANTVLVNLAECVDENGVVSADRTRSAIIHECFHAYRHRLFYLGQRFYNKNFHCLSCNLAGQTEAASISVSLVQKNSFQPELAGQAADQLSSRNPLDWIEWQANRVTPRIRMPAQTFQPKAEELLKQYAHLPEPERFARVVVELTARFQVSKQTAKLRMMELGWPQAQGVLNYVDGSYVENYSISPEELNKDETYTVSFSDALRLFQEDEAFQSLLSTGFFQYVEGHFCLLDKKYLCYKHGHLALTEYAKANMGECCLVFRIARKVQIHTYQQGTLRKETENLSCIVEFQSDRCASLKEDVLLKVNKLSETAYQLPANPGLTLCAHMTRLCMSVERLAELSGVGPRTIVRLRSVTNYKPKVDVAVAICIGLHLDPVFSEDWLKKLGIKLNYGPREIALRFVLTTLYWLPLTQVNETLASYGMEGLCTSRSEIMQ